MFETLLININRQDSGEKGVRIFQSFFSGIKIQVLA